MENVLDFTLPRFPALSFFCPKKRMLHNSLRRAGSHAAHGDHHHVSKHVKVVERTAAYCQNTNLGWIHAHKEMNYRKKALGIKAYSPEYMDPYAAFQTTYPYRHVETCRPGTWFGAAHFIVTPEHFGPYCWKWAAKTMFSPLTGVFLVCFGWWFRIGYINHYGIRNKGAVSGND